jgi:hypothetical protein
MPSKWGHDAIYKGKGKHFQYSAGGRPVLQPNGGTGHRSPQKVLVG